MKRFENGRLVGVSVDEADMEYELEGDGSGDALPEVEMLSVFEDIARQLGGIPCSGHLDFAAGTWTYHRERECSA